MAVAWHRPRTGGGSTLTHTERTHVIFGLALALLAGLALLAETRRSRTARSAWPILAILIGVILFIPVESQTRTYQSIRWGALLLTLAPDDPTAWVGDWIRLLRVGHVLQHKVGGLIAMLAGVVELARARGWVRADRWLYALPLCLVGVALAFGIHGGTSQHLPSTVERAQHWMLAVALGTGGLTLGLHRAGALRHHRWALVWPGLALLAGVSLALFYRLPAGASGHGGHTTTGAATPQGSAQ